MVVISIPLTDPAATSAVSAALNFPFRRTVTISNNFRNKKPTC
jgi:hypothetical protein